MFQEGTHAGGDDEDVGGFEENRGGRGRNTEVLASIFSVRGGADKGSGGGLAVYNHEKAYWKYPEPARRYMRLLEVVTPGSEGATDTGGITKDQYRQLNEFPLSKQSWSWAAFSGKPML